jgi:hypothetical protein
MPRTELKPTGAAAARTDGESETTPPWRPVVDLAFLPHFHAVALC